MTGDSSKSLTASSLDTLAEQGARWLRRSKLRDCLRTQLPVAIRLLFLVPVLALLIIGFGWLAGSPWKLSPFWLVALFLIPSLGYLVFHLVRALQQQPKRREGLAVYDETFELNDRLQTADEFLAAPEPTPFMEAAINDASPALERAKSQSLQWTWGDSWPELRALPVVSVVAVALLLLGIFLPPGALKEGLEENPGGEPVNLAANLPIPTDEELEPSSPEPVKPPEPKEDIPEEKLPSERKGEADPAKVSENPSNELEGRDKISVGSSEGGQTSQAASSGRASQSKGMPGSQAPSSRPEQTKETKKKDPKPANEKESGKEKKPVKDQSGATAGKGSSGGSSRNPASTDWASKDRTESADNENFEQEEDVDDEDSESEARGGLQPNLRDRRPAVNRDLSIGFGNMSNPDANGRGGPGQRKKSRGVAGLVLGVPIPDHVKGQPNPGRVKVNQERVQPQGEKIPGGIAEDRGERSTSPGHLSERILDRTERQIVRDYFLQTRAAEGTSSSSNPVDE